MEVHRDSQVSLVSMGGAPLGAMYGGSTDVDTYRDVVDGALRAGMNYIDTAPWYGDGKGEEVLGKVCIRLFVATCYAHGPRSLAIAQVTPAGSSTEQPPFAQRNSLKASFPWMSLTCYRSSFFSRSRPCSLWSRNWCFNGSSC
jgi:hypothetical protein